MSKSDDEWDQYPWISVEHRPPPKKKKDPNRKPKDYNKGKIHTAYQIRFAEDGTKWHSIVDVLRPHSPPVEWPEYPDKPLEDDFPENFRWEDLSDFEDEDDPIKCFKEMGIDEEVIKSEMKKMSKIMKTMKIPKKYKKMEEEEAILKAKSNFCPEIPTLVDDNDLRPCDDEAYEAVTQYRNTGYGGALKSGDDFYRYDIRGEKEEAHDTDEGFSIQPAEQFRMKEKKVKEWDFAGDSGDLSSDSHEPTREELWRELQET